MAESRFQGGSLYLNTDGEYGHTTVVLHISDST